eukprot:5553061-Amphidinium_carterae.1
MAGQVTGCSFHIHPSGTIQEVWKIISNASVAINVANALSALEQPAKRSPCHQDSEKFNFTDGMTTRDAHMSIHFRGT